MIGFQNGIKAAFQWIRTLPTVPVRPASYDPANKGTWPWPDKLEATLNDMVAMLNDHEARLNKLDPKPAPPKPQPAFWDRPGLFIAWGLYNGGRTFPGSEPHTIAQKAADAGFKWVALQWEPQGNRERAAGLREELKKRGLDFVVWEAYPSVGSGNTAVNAWNADAYIAQAEEPQPWSGIVATYTVGKPAAVVTTFAGLGAVEGGYDPSIAKPVVDAGWACFTEAYTNENVQWTPDRLNFTGVNQLGFPSTRPVIGLWEGMQGRLPASTYVNALNLGNYAGYAVWLAETMVDSDWISLGSFNTR